MISSGSKGDTPCSSSPSFSCFRQRDCRTDRRHAHLNPKADQSASCPATSRYEASGRSKKPGAQKLNELPDADAYRTVYRRIGGCEVPMIVKYGVSGR
jgi:hypothetical protein